MAAPFCRRFQKGGGCFQAEVEFVLQKILLGHSPEYFQPLAIVVEKCEVVHVAYIAACLAFFFQKMVERVEVHISKKLAGAVADR